jgi:hypothetical protein
MVGKSQPQLNPEKDSGLSWFQVSGCKGEFSDNQGLD